VRAPSLPDFEVQTYASWLRAHGDVFGATCDHEVAPRVYGVGEEEPGAGGKRARRARGHLKARQWTVGELLDGAPLKFTAAEAFRRACDRLRVWVPKV
jgi:hypothetical protein